MAAVVGALELDDHQVGLVVDAQQVDAPPRVFPLAELLGDDEGVRGDHVNAVAQQALQVGALAQAGLAEGRLVNIANARRLDLVDGHGTGSRMRLEVCGCGWRISTPPA